MGTQQAVTPVRVVNDSGIAQQVIVGVIAMVVAHWILHPKKARRR